MYLIELENAVILFLFDNEEKLGTVTSSIPRMGIEGSGMSTVLMGVKHHLLSRSLAERASAKFNKIALVSVNIHLSETAVFKASMDLLNKLEKEISIRDSSFRG